MPQQKDQQKCFSWKSIVIIICAKKAELFFLKTQDNYD